MTLMQFSGLLVVYLISVGIILTLSWLEYRRVRFNFNVLFSVLFFLTFWFGFPLTCLLVFQFNVDVVPAENLLQAMLAASGFYIIYYVSYKTRLTAPRRLASKPFFRMNRLETHFSWILLTLVAVSAVGVFFMQNGFLLFRLHAYSQIFSSSVSGVALKRFFYFFIPAMLVLYFLRQNRRSWLLFFIFTACFGGLTYMIVGGTRANLIIAFALFLFIGTARGWIKLWILISAGGMSVLTMFWLALHRYHLDVSGSAALYTFLYLTRDTFSPWENLGLLFANYENLDFQGIGPIIRDFYVFIPSWLWHDRPDAILNSANYFTWDVLDNHSGLTISPTLIGSLVIMGGVMFIPFGAIITGLIIKWFDFLYALGKAEPDRYKAAIIHSFCFGAVFNIIVLSREGLDAFASRVVFFSVIFSACVLTAKLLYWLFDHAGLIASRVSPS